MAYGSGNGHYGVHRPRWGQKGSKWTPADIPGNVLWLSAGYGCYSDDGGTTPSGDGDVIAFLRDRSGNGYNATQTNNTKRPILKTNIQNGEPVIRFDGIDDGLIVPRMEGKFSAGFTYFVVAKVDDGHPSAQQSIFGSIDTQDYPPNAYYYFYCFNRTNGDLRISVHSGATTAEQYPTTLDDGASDFFIIDARADPADKFGAFYNGSSSDTPVDITGLNWGNIAGENTERVSLGGRWRDGAIEDNYYFDGDIAELIIYGRPLSDSERSKVRNYLAVKYDITIN